MWSRDISADVHRHTASYQEQGSPVSHPNKLGLLRHTKNRAPCQPPSKLFTQQTFARRCREHISMHPFIVNTENYFFLQR